MVSLFKAIRDNNVALIRDIAEQVLSLPVYNNKKGQSRDPFNKHLQQNRSSRDRTHYDLNRRSIKGRTPLHCAATWNRVAILKILVECPVVNVNLQDQENGWTALHRALYLGHVEAATILLRHEHIDTTIKDWNGYSAIELLQTHLDLTYPVREISYIHKNPKTNDEHDASDLIPSQMHHVHAHAGGTDLYFWGVNTNYLLGHREAAKASPERVQLAFETVQNWMGDTRVVLETVCMSKYHTAVLTSEARYNLHVCGFARGGRLGIPHVSDAQLSLVPVPWPERIVAVALGKNHTIALTESKNVITFGSNESGQLGYELDEGQCQTAPRKVQAPGLKKHEIRGVAASNVHSVIYTLTDIYTFGANRGQLGYHASGSCELQTLPRKVAFGTRIIQVVATNFATAILFENNEVILLCNYGQQKIIFPTERFPADMQVYTSSYEPVVKLLDGSEDTLGAITTAGEVFLWTCEPSHTDGTWQTKPKDTTTKVSRPRRVWRRRKPHLEARDACIGGSGQLVVCTVLGNVFCGQPASRKADYDFQWVPQLQRCVRVCASPSHAFAAIRADLQVGAIDAPVSTLSTDMARALPHVMVSKRLEDEYAKMDHARGVLLSQALPRDLADEAGYEPRRLAAVLGRQWESARSSAWRDIDRLADVDPTLDVAFCFGEERTVYCHQLLLAARSPFFQRLVSGKTNGEPLVIDKQTGRWKVWLPRQYSVDAFLMLVHFIYTDEVCSKMTLLANCDMPLAAMQAQVAELGEIFELEVFGRKATLAGDLGNLRLNQGTHDTTLKLQDSTVTCHALVIRQRCPFFDHLLEPGAPWVEARRDALQPHEKLPLYLDDISHETADTLLRYLYHDCDSRQLFGQTTKETVDEVIHALLDVLRVADELLLSTLKSLCQRSLLKLLSPRTALLLLDYADLYAAQSLKGKCIEYVTGNLNLFLATGALDNLETGLIHGIEACVQSCLANALPSVARYDKAPETDLEDELSSSLFTQSRENTHFVSNYAESLMTLYPQYPAKLGAEEDDMLFTMDDVPKSVAKKDVTKSKKKGKAVANSVVDIASPAPASPGGAAWTPVEAGSFDLYSRAKPSLREILEQESKRDAPSAVAKKGGVKKLSQKERRKMQQQLDSIQLTPSPPKSVWGKVPTVSPASLKPSSPPPVAIASTSTSTGKTPPPSKYGSSFDDKGKKIVVSHEQLLAEQEQEAQRRLQEQQKRAETTFNPATSLGETFRLTPRRGAAQKKSADTAPFSAILKQQELEDNWIKGKGRVKKNLLRIQTEERAIEGLQQFYVQTLEGNGEWFSVRAIET
ncbi:hypothetical protein BCR43DRAFT_495018 [Syncephalastrum racemosum]|uniref:BTB domain-containing protein n=1 Tax=Syncephalastrum racemosum TaxID=13706 RepID=A0A1X2H902_SYNRA|nr:hypothetical protein BCR43DRAFT_495018 [Syncephalastrum racemosum]